MKSAIAMFVAFIAMAGLVTAQEEFDCGVTIGSSSGTANSAAAGGWTYPAGWGEDPLAGAGGDNAWRPWTNGTGSGGTGPSAGNGGGGVYMYVETSSGAGNVGVQASLYTPATSAGNMDFAYHMLGATQGTLTVEEDLGGVWTSVFSVTGDQGGAWINSGPIAITGTQVRFRYSAGGGFTGDCAIDTVNLPGVTPATATYSANNADASLDINGSAAATICEGDTASINASINAANAGALHDIGYSTSPIVSACNGGVPLIDDSVNLDLGTTSSIYGGMSPNLQPFGLGFGGSDMSIVVAPAAGIATHNLQMGALDATDPDGISMSATASLVAVLTGVNPSLSLGDDATVRISTCNAGWTNVDFYGTSYDHVHVNSNGDISFTAGHTDFQPSAATFTSQMPRCGIHADLSPNMGGTVDYVQLADGFRVDYANVPGFGSSGIQSWSIEVSASAGAEVSNILTDGLFAASASILGISNGSAGTGAVGVLGGGFMNAVVFDSSPINVGLATDNWVDFSAATLPSGAGTTYTGVNFAGADGSSASTF